MPHFGSIFSVRPQAFGRMPILLCAALTLCFVLLAAFSLYEDRESAVARANQTADNLATVLAEDMAREIGLYDRSLQAVVHGLELPGLWELSPDLRQMVLFDRAAAAPQFGFLNVLNESGDVIADMQAKSPRAANFAARDYFQAHRRDPQDQALIGRPFLTAPGQPTAIPISRRLSHPDGSFAGVVVGSIRLSYVQDLFKRLDLGAQGTVMLLRNDGLVLMRMPFAQDDIGRTLPDTAPFFRTIGRDNALIEAVDPDGIQRITAFRRVGDLPLTIAVALGRTEIDQAWWFRAALLLAATLALCGMDLTLIGAIRRSTGRRIRAEAEAARERDDASRTMATVSHELRTPLTSILGSIEMLRTTKVPGHDHDRLIDGITAASIHMRHVMDRTLTRAPFMASPPRAEPTDLDLLVSDIRFMTDRQALERGLAMTHQIDPGLPRAVYLDAGRVREVLDNLLTNAIKYTERGGVTLRLTGAAGRLRCEVADTGPGIPADKQARLFQAYDRLDTTRPVSGNGLGLWITQQLVQGMGGRIGYQDNQGGGSLFWIELPLNPVPLEPVSAVCPAPSPTARSSRPLRILLVDDNATNRQVAAAFLTAAGHTPTEAANGGDALQIATREVFDLIVTDLRMPNMTGLQLSKHVRDLAGPRSRTPILLLTADMSVSRQTGFDAARITLLLPKPFTADELLAAVDQATRQTVPDRQPDSGGPALLDRDVLDQLARAIGVDALDAHMQALSGRLCDLLALLRHPDDRNRELLDDLIHDTAGAAGVLGFLPLSAALRRAEQGEDAGAGQAARLTILVDTSLAALRRHLAASTHERAIETVP